MLVGWSAVTNSLDWAPVVLFAVIFYWTPPHFWALAIRYRDDYAAADVPMLPVVASLRTTAIRILALHAAAVGADAAVRARRRHGRLLPRRPPSCLGAVFTWYAVRLVRDRHAKAAMRLFTWSITYITLLFGAMAVDQLLRSGF